MPLRRPDRYQLCLIVVAMTYCAILIAITPLNSVMWDEVSHLNGGLLFSRGQISQWALTNSFYPPAYDVFTAFSFLVLGPSVLAARLVSLVFSVFTLFMVYAIANLLLESKSTAVLAAVFFAVGPGIVWLSKSAMIETMLVFVFCLCMYYYFRVLKTNTKKDQVLCVLAFALGVLVKYQVLVVVPIIVLVGLAFWKRDYLRQGIAKWGMMPRIAIVAAVVAVIAVGIMLLFSTKAINYYLYAFGVGSQEKAFFSTRYPLPVFYLVEMAWFSETLHPISVLLYGLGLAGLVWIALRRNSGGKKLLLWFIVVYLVFTFVPNREWRYVIIAFPVLAIAASAAVALAWNRLHKIGTFAQGKMQRLIPKIAAIGLVLLSAGAIGISAIDGVTWMTQYRVEVPVEQSSVYVRNHIGADQTLVVACPVNHFNKYMVMFYFGVEDASPSFNDTCQTYPNYAMDSFNPDFNVTELSEFCGYHNTAYVMLYEYGNFKYFESELTALKVADMLDQTGTYNLAQTFGEQPHRIFIYTYTNQR